MRGTFTTYNRASLATACGNGDTHTAAVACHITVHMRNTPPVHAGLYAYAGVNPYPDLTSIFNQFDCFNDLAFQCVEAQTFGYSYDADNDVVHIIDCTQR